MKNRLALPLPIIAVGILLIVNLHTIRAQNPVVSRDVTSAEKHQYVTINGAVSMPGRFELSENMHLNILLTRAGGWTEQAEGTIRIDHFMPESKTGDFEVVKLRDLLAGHEEANPNLQSGDIVTVVEAKPFYIIGSVGAPQVMLLKEGYTLGRAIAMVGGPLKDARQDNVRIYRLTSGGTALNIITVDLKAIKAKHIEDVALQPYDIVEVPNKSGHVKSPILIKPGPIAPKITEGSWRVIY